MEPEPPSDRWTIRPLEQPTARSAGGGPVPDYRLKNGAEEPSLAWEGARLLLTLAAVLAVLGLAVRVLRRWPARIAGGRAGSLQVLERVALTPKEAICLVRAGGELLVVGVGPSGVTLLTRLTASAEEALRSAVTPAGSGGALTAVSPRGFRLRELAARLQQVQAAWGLDDVPPRGNVR